MGISESEKAYLRSQIAVWFWRKRRSGFVDGEGDRCFVFRE